MITAETPVAAPPATPARLYVLSYLFVPGLYLVLAFSVVLTAAVGLGLIYLLLSHGWVGGIVVALGIGVVLGIFACVRGVIKSIWSKPPRVPALRVEVSEQRRLYAFIRRLCEEMDTLVPDVVLLHSQPTFFVTQGRLQTANGSAEGRILVIGLPLLNIITQQELRAILAHEFAHFTGNDTRYSTVVLPVYLGATAAMEQMTSHKSGIFAQLPLIIPVFLLRQYLQTFHRLNMRISRSREFRADYLSAEVVGHESVASALIKTFVWADLINGILFPDPDDKRDRTNVYAQLRDNLPHFRTATVNPPSGATPLLKLIENMAMSAVDSPYSSHPTLRARIQNLPPSTAATVDENPAMELILNPEEYEIELTRLLNTGKVICEGNRLIFHEGRAPDSETSDASQLDPAL